ncbi:MAG: hypothetical protein M0P31_16265 [Solirubrobacteraceae bacterium]|nr:hypothetical protein [Solirubrobacteraceae bacterium]
MTAPHEHEQDPVADAPSAAVARDCERCGAGATADQEWCLGCGARLTPAVERLPGLRAAAVTVAAAVLLAGGAAAAAYAALSNDASDVAQAPATASGTPVPQATTPAVPPAVGTTPPASPTAPPADVEPDEDEDDTAALDDEDVEDDDTTDLDAGAGDDDADADDGSDAGSPSPTTSTRTTTTTTRTTTTAKSPSGPLSFGSGSLYDPDGVLADKGDDGAAIDGKTSTSWKFTLNEGKAGGFGYVLDFATPTTVETLTLRNATKGMVVKVLGTTQRDLPPDALDLGWDALTSETPTRSGSTKLSLKDAAGRTRKYRHVLVLVSTVPGTPAAGEIAEISGTS